MGQETPRNSNLPAHEDGHSPPNQARPPQPGSAVVVARFLFRMIILSVFASLGAQGYPKTLESLLVMATLFCAIVAAIRREAPFGPALTHFDEAAAYALCARIAAWAV